MTFFFREITTKIVISSLPKWKISKMKNLAKYCLAVCSVFLILILPSCAQNKGGRISSGAENISEYLDLIANKKIAVVANQSSLVQDIHLVDFLLERKIDLVKIFSPEHGFRGNADAGMKLGNTVDEKTGIPIVSLYGNHYKPTSKDLKGVELILFDLQDVGVRFYTYISTLHYVMEACAEQGVPVIVLDRPNPNGHYVDGPVLQANCRSFVGLHPVPIVYGMSIGEYAKMINGEKWLKHGVQCELKVIPCMNWNRSEPYFLPVKPSPNLPNHLAITLYPSLCFFEGTVVSAGRGTNQPFQCYGHPLLKSGTFEFVPKSIFGASTNPKFKGEKCFGYDLTGLDAEKVRKMKRLNLAYLILAYSELNGKTIFFNSFFENLAGTTELRKQIQQNFTEEEIRKSWEQEIKQFLSMRTKYLIYPDFDEN